MTSSAYEVIGIGVDLLKVSRIQKLCARARHRSQRSLPMQSPSYASNGDERFAAKILNRQEKEAYDAAFPVGTALPRLAERAQYLAVRWGLKEAAFKAAFPHHRLTWHQMMVTKTEGKPSLHVDAGSSAAEELKRWRWHASVAHDGDDLYATVIALAPASTGRT